MLSILLVQELVTCSLRFCGLDYFITILEMLQLSRSASYDCNLLNLSNLGISCIVSTPFMKIQITLPLV